VLGGGSSTTTTQPPPSGPPAGGTVVDGEDLAGASAVLDSRAHGGAFGRMVRGSAAAGVAPGTYRLTARVKAPATTRIDLLTADLMAGSYGIGTGWKTVRATVTISSPGQTVGAGSWARTGSGGSVDVDWLHLAASLPTLTVRGGQLIGADGQPFLPKGFNRGGFQGARTIGGRLDLPDDEAHAIAVWGPAMVRIGLNQEHWLANCPSRTGTVDTTYRAAVRNEVDQLTASGAVVVVALVGSSRGAATGCDAADSVLNEMADRRSLDFWGSVAGLFKSNPLVAFDLFNEPHGISDAVWRDGGTVTYGSTVFGPRSYAAVGMQALYGKVRGTGATNVVLVSGNRWASDPRVHLTNPLDGYGVVAASHSYCHECPEDAPALRPDIEILNSAEVRARHPLTISETGWRSHDDSTYNRAAIDWCDARSVGWLVYGWLDPAANDVPDRFSLLASGSPTFEAGGELTRPPAASGTPVWNELAPLRVARGDPALPLPE
jgi:hypothetical protein